MNAPLRNPFGRLLAANYHHHGLTLDLYGALTDDGYEVQHVLIPGSLIALTECVSAELLDTLGAALDDTLPSAEQLRRASSLEGRADIAQWNRDMDTFGWPGMA